MLDFRQLQIFMAIWEKRSVSQAAESVYLTQPTVSAHLRALEEQLGTRLFDRTSKEVVPTAAGRLLYPYVQKILRLNRQAEEAMASFRGEERGTLEIGASNIPGQYLLPRLLMQFKEERPMIDVRLFIGDTASIVSRVISGQLETGLVGAMIGKKKLEYRECFHDELTLVTAVHRPAASLRALNIEDILNLPLIMREKGSGTRLTIENSLAGHGISLDDLNIVMEMGSTEAVRQGVKAGLGCAFISNRAVKDDIEYGVLKSLPVNGIEIRRKFFLVSMSNRSLSPSTRSFMNFIVRESKRS